MGNQEVTVLSHIRKYGQITQMDAVQLGIYRLSARVYNLRIAGHDIKTNILEVPNRYGTISKFARYTMPSV